MRRIKQGSTSPVLQVAKIKSCSALFSMVNVRYLFTLLAATSAIASPAIFPDVSFTLEATVPFKRDSIQDPAAFTEEDTSRDAATSGDNDSMGQPPNTPEDEEQPDIDEDGDPVDQDEDDSPEVEGGQVRLPATSHSICPGDICESTDTDNPATGLHLPEGITITGRRSGVSGRTRRSATSGTPRRTRARAATPSRSTTRARS